MLHRCGLELTPQRLRGLCVFVTPSTEGLADPSRAAAVPVRGAERGRQRVLDCSQGCAHVSCCCCNRSSQTSWRKAAHVHGPMALPVRVGGPGVAGLGLHSGSRGCSAGVARCLPELRAVPVLVAGRNAGPRAAAAKPLPPRWPPDPRPSSRGLQTSKVAPIPSQAPDFSESPSCLWLGRAPCS